jgi:hypothetical protein
VHSDAISGATGSSIVPEISGNVNGKFISKIVITGSGATINGTYPVTITGTITYNNIDEPLFETFETQIYTSGSFLTPSIDTSSINVERLRMQAPNPIRKISSNFTINPISYGEFIVVESNTVTVTIGSLTLGSSAPRNILGAEIHIFRETLGEVTIAAPSGVTLLSEGNKRRINDRYQAVTLKNIGVNR